MRQKVGKERSQGDYTPLANPRRFWPALSESSARRPSPRGRKAAWATGPRDSANRETAPPKTQPPLSPHNAVSKNRACRLQPAWSARWRRLAKTTHVVWSISYSSSRARGFSLYLEIQTQQKPRRGGRPRGFHLDCALAQRVKSLFRRAGNQKPASTALRGRRLTKAERTPAKHPTGAPGGRCLPAPGTGHSGEKPN